MPTTNPVPATPENEEELRGFCDQCGDDYPESSLTPVGGEIYCPDCHDEYTATCEDCEERFHNDHLHYVGSTLNGYICPDCLESDRFFTCDDCGERFTSDFGVANELTGTIDLCLACREENGRRTNRPRREPNMRSTDLQSNQVGEIIKSKRRFGIELETVFNRNDSVQQLSNLVSPSWGFQGDGSIHTNKDAVGGIEIVSPVMKGKAGEDEIKRLCEKAKEAGFFVNTSCGYHLHLEALDFKRDPKKDQLEVHPKLPTTKNIYTFDYRDPFNNDRIQKCKTENYDEIPFSEPKAGKKRRTRVPYETEVVEIDNRVKVNRGDSFFRLRDLLYVYIAFDDVFRAMQPPSRRNNTFCKATNSLYSLDAVRRLGDFNDLEVLWYKIDRTDLRQVLEVKEQRKSYMKDGTRYSGFNLEPIIRKQGSTIELRYHSPTLNPNKILKWADLHQTIFDKVSDGAFSEEAVNHVIATETNILKKAKSMCEIFGVRKETEEYVMERLHKFNKFNAKADELQDEEVSEAQVGRRSHGGTIDDELMFRPNRSRPAMTGRTFSAGSSMEQFRVAMQTMSDPRINVHTARAMLERIEGGIGELVDDDSDDDIDDTIDETMRDVIDDVSEDIQEIIDNN